MPSFSILLYTKNEYTRIECTKNSCEDVCLELCKLLGFKPVVFLLFSLRNAKTNNFLPGCNPLSSDDNYEFRLRFQLPVLATLNKLDKIAYNYLYHQVKSDLVNGHISELEYPKHKNEVIGFCVTSMYIEMLENNMSIDDLEKNYKNYIPHKHVKKHSFILQRKVSEKLRSFRNLQHDSYYVKGAYLESINRYAPGYLVEKYASSAPYYPTTFLNEGHCKVDLEFSPFHNERPGISVFYSSQQIWQHISTIENIYTITTEDEGIIKMEMRDKPGFELQIKDKDELESFISCITGYYRLMFKWTVDLYENLPSPSLNYLTSLKCHGPIGGEFAYFKLREKDGSNGTYLVRQCEKEHDTYYIDIIMKSNKPPQTFQITFNNEMWNLHIPSEETTLINSFSNLVDLANSIGVEGIRKNRVPPSEYDKSPLLLLCRPPEQLTAKKTLSESNAISLKQNPPQILDLANFGKYINSQKLIEDGKIIKMQAEWNLPKNKKIEVTLKILNSEKHVSEFMQLAEKLRRLDTTEFIKMYGLTINYPQAIVLESMKLGSLDTYLRAYNTKIKTVCLIETAQTLARALLYLQEINFCHGKIRCSSLQVVQFSLPSTLVVRLGDPGLQTKFTKEDLPWIPINNDTDKYNTKSEVWAYATTLWEIFSYGKLPTAKQFISLKHKLKQPEDCPNDIYKIMLDGWNPLPELRFSPQAILSKLTKCKEEYTYRYESLLVTDNTSVGSSHSVETERTHINSQTSISNGSTTDFDRQSIHSESSTSSDISGQLSIEEHKPLYLSNKYATHYNNHISRENVNMFPFAINYSAIAETEDGAKVIFQGQIGKGNFGTVFKGSYEIDDCDGETVAIKTLNNEKLDKNAYKEFDQEIKIMRSLNHPNIVKIITWMEKPAISIVMEYVRHGSLLMYLNSNRPTLKNKNLLKFAKDIASGMECLASKKVLHRDLAARNILVDSDDCVKISDFGLSRIVDSNYYITQNIGHIPIRWYAPEAIQNRYSFYSDVWSYGVTLFEMFSRGEEPNLQNQIDLKPDEILELLKNNVRLERPPLCPEDIYNNLLMECWHLIPDKRPTFTKLLNTVNNFLAEYGQEV